MHFSIINQVSVSTLDLPGFMGWDKFLNLENFLTLNHFQIWTAALGPTTKNSPSQETTLEKSNSTHIQWLNQRWGFFLQIYNKRNYLQSYIHFINEKLISNWMDAEPLIENTIKCRFVVWKWDVFIKIHWVSATLFSELVSCDWWPQFPSDPGGIFGWWQPTAVSGRTRHGPYAVGSGKLNNYHKTQNQRPTVLPLVYFFEMSRKKAFESFSRPGIIFSI